MTVTKTQLFAGQVYTGIMSMAALHALGARSGLVMAALVALAFIFPSWKVGK